MFEQTKASNWLQLNLCIQRSAAKRCLSSLQGQQPRINAIRSLYPRRTPAANSSVPPKVLLFFISEILARIKIKIDVSLLHRVTAGYLGLVLAHDVR